MNIYYLGPQGTYSSEIAHRSFPKEKLVSSKSFEAVVTSTLNDNDSIGILPIENTSSSSVHTNVDLIFKNPLSIVGEATMSIHLYLWGKKGIKLSDVGEVYSHPQALMQCSSFLEKYNMKTRPAKSTVDAVKKMSKDSLGTVAFVGGDSIAENGFEILKKNIENHAYNMTRFVFVCAQEAYLDSSANKITAIFKLAHTPGSLVKALSGIAKRGGNVTRIESRPVPGTDWEYQFLCDIEIPCKSCESFVSFFQDETRDFRLVGAYKKGITYH